MTRSIYDILTDTSGNPVNKIREVCGGCNKPRIIRAWHLDHLPDSWVPSDLTGLCRACESKRQNGSP